MEGEAIGFGQQEQYIRRFCHAYGTPNYFSCDSLCFASTYIGYSLVEGGAKPIGDFINSKYIIIWGEPTLYILI